MLILCPGFNDIFQGHIMDPTPKFSAMTLDMKPSSEIKVIAVSSRHECRFPVTTAQTQQKHKIIE